MIDKEMGNCLTSFSGFEYVWDNKGPVTVLNIGIDLLSVGIKIYNNSVWL